ncbi:one helix protein [Klebsormidium nitens]|uniref:One helix protein n=1 Tax=Klebsormidium nitens TaxID=105231 RepID=A0A1Y1I0E0_KLENI|nr:one helix protein [Klebsormidium nitens]|eukprot:GAQ82899.1 one helix protein [Klebsormidium nitens]
MASAVCIQQFSQICSLSAGQAHGQRGSASSTCAPAHCSGSFLRKEGLTLPLPGRLTTAAPHVASSRSSRLVARAVSKAPPGVEPPRQEPKLPQNLVGFTENAEVWNSRAGMIGIFGIAFVELIANRGILEMVGITVGKGLDLPL